MFRNYSGRSASARSNRQIKKSYIGDINIKSSIKIYFAGDFVFNKDIAESFKKNPLKKDIIFNNLKDADFVIINLETPLTNEAFRENKSYNFKASPEILDFFNEKFIFHIGNNHILDCGEKGLTDTINNLKEKKFLYGGAGRNIEEAGKPVIIEINSVKVGLICAADPRFNRSENNKAGTFPALPELINKKIDEIKDQVDLVIISIHAGIEFLKLPSVNQVRDAKNYLANGAGVVSFHHSHSFSGYTYNHEGVILYGLGNFIFPFRHKFLKHCFQTALYSINYSKDKKISGLNIKPMIIGEDGIPYPAAEKSKEIEREIKKVSQKISSLYLKYYLLLAMINYNYLKVNLINYTSIAKEQGVIMSFKRFLNGIKTQLK